MFVSILLLTFIFECCRAENCPIVLNIVVDKILDILKILINKKGWNEIILPDTYHEYDHNMYLIKLKGYINCSDGSVGQLSTIKRTGDTVMYTEDNKATIRIRLGLEKLGFNFANCAVKTYYLFSFTNQVNGSVGNNSIDLQISLGGEGSDCAVTIDHVKLDRFDDLNINIGNGVGSTIAKKLIEWLSSYFNERIVSYINKALIDVTSELLPELNLCSNVPII